MKGWNWLFLSLIAVGAFVLASGGGLSGGASLFIILHESTKDDEAFSKMAIQIQDSASPVAKAISDAKWKALVFDDDATDGDTKPLKLLVDLGVHGTITDSKRELLSIAPPSTLVSKEPIPPDATGETVLSMMKARGKR